MKILITGVGITGKSTLRRYLKKYLEQALFSVQDIDGDYHKIPKVFNGQTIYILEDVHATLSNACLSLRKYDLIFYLYPLFHHHLIFWLDRVWVWFQNGYGSWDKDRGTWLGTNKPRDIRNIPLFLKLMFRDLRNRRKWIREDFEVLLPFRVSVVCPRWTKNGIEFYPDPLSVFRATYTN